MKPLCCDFETTGLPSREPVYPVQLAWILDDDTGRTRESACYLVRPDGWTIPDRVVEIHGITTELALEWGRPLVEVLDLFLSACSRADLLVAHNVAFDWEILLKSCALMGRPLPELPQFCTMRESRYLVPPQPGRSDRHGPNLTRAYAWATGGLALDGAHSADVDVAACRAVYYGILKARG
jgi:DNA polymerase-3 subunit epsilon